MILVLMVSVLLLVPMNAHMDKEDVQVLDIKSVVILIVIHAMNGLLLIAAVQARFVLTDNVSLVVFLIVISLSLIHI